MPDRNSPAGAAEMTRERLTASNSTRIPATTANITRVSASVANIKRDRPATAAMGAVTKADKIKKNWTSERIEWVLVNTLRPHSRVLWASPSEEEQLTRSVESTGIIAPLIITQNRVVIDGRKRLKVAKKLRLPKLPVLLLATMDSLEIEEMVLSLNAREEPR